ncbi:hypothetical protein POM88_004360 [Heracleum sosnowskyi]|uniref:Photosystem I assembly protein Ycf4 n=1 Tax=Heracleum sosnowskyi TaxID=360622 RepID=A0AAD8JMQ9_9APIA|nr:hypothetical protein POM88_004360 [Heracleum sosnowskyi]
MAAFLFLLLPSKEIIIATSPAETFDEDIDIGILPFIVGSSGYLLWKGYGRLKVKGNRDKFWHKKVDEIIIATSPAETFDEDIDIGILLFIVGSSGYLLWKGYGRLKVKGNRDKLYTFYSTTL